MGGLHKRGHIWWISYPQAGRQMRESSHSTNKRVAQNLLSLRRAQVLEGRLQLPKSKPPRFEEWAKQFLESVQHASTRERYGYSIQSLKVHFKAARLSEITPDLIARFIDDRRKSGVKSATINRDLATLRRMLNLAKRRRMIGQNPFAEVELLEERKQRRQPHILTFDEQWRLLAVAPPHLRMLIVLITETGLRVGKEALPLKWQDVDVVADTVKVRESKTVAGIREIPLSGYCKEELSRWRYLTGPDFSPYVFFNFLNPSVHLQAVRKVWTTSLKRANIEYFPIYNLRHSFSTRAHEVGISPLTLAQMLGHASTAMLPTYAKVLDQARREAIQKLEEYRQSHPPEISVPSADKLIPTL